MIANILPLYGSQEPKLTLTQKSKALEKGQILITLFKPLNRHPLKSNLLLEFSLARATTFYFCLAHCEMDFLSFATKSHN